jgi:tetratricopeptide (TPR) repeat protein
MPAGPEFPIRMRILLPFLAAVALLVAPKAGELQNALISHTSAQEFQQPEKSAGFLASMAQWEPWRPGLWQQAGSMALRGGDVQLAIVDLEKAKNMNQLDDAGWLTLGEAYWTLQRWDEAVKIWAPLMEQHRAPVEIYQRAVNLRLLTGWVEEAARWASAWWATYPQDGRAAYMLGLASLPYDEPGAVTALRAASGLDPGWSANVTIITQAISKLALDSPPESRLVETGRALGSVGEWSLALVSFEKAKTLSPQYAQAWAFASEAKQQLHQDGNPDLEQALALAPDSPVILALAAVNYRRQGDTTQALERFTQASVLEPDRAIWQIEIGNTYADLHNIQKGLEFYQAAARIESVNPMVWRLTAQYCLNNELFIRETALPAARQAVALAPEDAANLDILGQVMSALQDEISAERFLQQAIDKDLDNAPARLHLAQLYLRQGRLDWAQYHLALAARPVGLETEANLVAKRLLARFFGTP